MARSATSYRLRLLIAATAIGFAAPVLSRQAMAKQDANWPCMAIEVPDLSPAAMWAGPPIAPYENTWSQDPAVAQLAAELSERRVPLSQAQADIKSFATKAGPDRKTKLLELLAGLFQNLNAQRESVIAGLDRYGSRQIELADLIKQQLDTLHGLQAQPQPDTTKVEDLGKQLQWEMRTFTERQRTTQYVCQVPDVIEQRLFALTRTIQQELG